MLQTRLRAEPLSAHSVKRDCLERFSVIAADMKTSRVACFLFASFTTFLMFMRMTRVVETYMTYATTAVTGNAAVDQHRVPAVLVCADTGWKGVNMTEFFQKFDSTTPMCGSGGRCPVLKGWDDEEHVRKAFMTHKRRSCVLIRFLPRRTYQWPNHGRIYRTCVNMTVSRPRKVTITLLPDHGLESMPLGILYEAVASNDKTGMSNVMLSVTYTRSELMLWPPPYSSWCRTYPVSRAFCHNQCLVQRSVHLMNAVPHDAIAINASATPDTLLLPEDKKTPPVVHCALNVTRSFCQNECRDKDCQEHQYTIQNVTDMRLSRTLSCPDSIAVELMSPTQPDAVVHLRNTYPMSYILFQIAYLTWIWRSLTPRPPKFKNSLYQELIVEAHQRDRRPSLSFIAMLIYLLALLDMLQLLGIWQFILA